MDTPYQTSCLKKIPTGIQGFDEISGGGLPLRRTTLLVGGPGSGKTVFALNTLVNGAREYGEPGIFVAFEENTKQIFENSASFGWNLPELVDQNLFFIDARMSSDVIQSGDFDLTALLAGVSAKAQEMSEKCGGKPVRIIFDAADVLLSNLEDVNAEREELYRIHTWLEGHAFSGIVTAKSSMFEGGQPQRGYLPYMSDCVIELKRLVREGVSHRTLTIIKYRGSSFAESEFSMVIGPHGVEVPSLSIFDLSYPVYQDRISSGVEQLDKMLGGGYTRATSVLVTGSPGTAKSTLAGTLLDAACRRGERSLYISFDEGPEEIMRNLSSVGVDLQRHVDTGMLRMYSSRAEARSAVEHLVDIKRMIKEQRPKFVVIDPLSAMEKAGGEQLAKSMAQRLIYEAKAEGITLFLTSLLAGKNPELEATPIEISTIADTWIHLSYVIQAGERNRALTIIKSRGTKHSNQVRELILSDEGVDLTDVYTAGGEVLMGTMRFEKEFAERERWERQEIEQTRLLRELELRRAEAKAKMEAANKEMEASDAEIANLSKEINRHEAQAATNKARVRQLRGDTHPEADGA